MANQDVESGFEALLKPLEDISSKMWDIMLTEALEKYLAQLNNGDTANVNFTEAAVLVQNSASFYCKRVDSVHLGCRQFVDKLINTYNSVFGSNQIMDKIIHENFTRHNDKEEGDGDCQQIKKKRSPKTYINDDFEPLDLFYSDGNLDVNLNTIDKYAEKKKVILNKYIKSAKKPNTSCPVYQTKGLEMGLKEEFRLHWGISSNGVLNEDFLTTSILRTLDWKALSDELMSADPEPDVLQSSFIQLENGFQMDVDDHLDALAASSPRAPSPIPPALPSVPPIPLPSENLALEKPAPTDYYKELEFNFIIPTNAILKKQQFSLPVSLINEINDFKVRKHEAKIQSKNPNYTFSSFFDFLKHRILLHKSSSDEEKAYQNAKIWRQEILKRQKQYRIAVATAAEDANEHFLGFDDDIEEDNNFEDLQLNNVGDLVDVNIPDVERDTAAQDREEMMTAFQENKKRCAEEQIEVAKRVQEWHESMTGVLDEAEARSQFDVHDYGSRILAAFDEPPQNKPVISFDRVVENQPNLSKAEISRYFLSTLMLANTYNVEILQEPGDLVKDGLRLKLLSTVRHHEEIDDNLKSSTHC